MPCTQQDAVYRAERSLPNGRGFGSSGEAEVFIEDLLDRYPRMHVDFTDVLFIDVFVGPAKRSTARAEGEGGAINMIPGQMSERFLLHETAHVLADSRYGSCGHSPWYARTMLELVYLSMGPDAYAILHSAYEDAGVDSDTDDAGGQSGVRL